MTTICFKYDNGQYLAFTAPKSTPLEVAIKEARDNKPAAANRFKIVKRGLNACWMR